MFILLCVLLVALDLFVTNKRMQKFGYQVELNPLVRYVAETDGMAAALATLLVSNLVLLALISPYPTLVHIFTGAKSALAALQLRSLSLEQLDKQR